MNKNTPLRPDTNALVDSASTILVACMELSGSLKEVKRLPYLTESVTLYSDSNFVPSTDTHLRLSVTA